MIFQYCLFILFHQCLSVAIGTRPSRRVVTIIATNDIHGHAIPIHLTRTDTQEQYTQGGLSTLASLINIVRKQNPGNTLYFDCGDQYQGGLENSPTISSGKVINRFIDHMKLDGAAIGNHQFDYGYEFLQTFLGNRRTVNLAANIENKKGKSVFLPNQQISHLYSLQNGLKIGAIGLTTKLTPRRSPGWALNDEKLKQLAFKDYTKIVQLQSKKLRAQGADAIILVVHVGEECFINTPRYGLWTSKSKVRECDRNGQIHRLLNELPTGCIDAVLQGHYHATAHSYIKNIPVMGNNMGGKYFNILYLQFQGKKISKSIIEGPVPVCQKVFRRTMQCQFMESEQELRHAGDLVNWKLHGVKVKPDLNVQEILRDQLLGKMQPYMQVLCYSEKLLKPSYNEETELNNLLAMAVHSVIPDADFTILAPSLLRQKLYPGPIRKVDIYNFHPFNSPFVLIKLLGSDLVSALSYLQTLEDSFHFSNQLQQRVWMSVNGQKKGMKGVTWYNGSEIDPQAELTGIMHNFTLGFVETQFKIQKIRTFGTVRSVFENYLKSLGRITKNMQLVNPNRPHLIVQLVPNEQQPFK